MQSLFSSLLSIVLLISFGSVAFASNPIVCAKELAEIDFQPPNSASTYFKKLEYQIKSSSATWFNSLTLDSAASTFGTTYNIDIDVYDAMGSLIYTSGTAAGKAFVYTYERAVALNTAAYTVLGGKFYYAFTMRNEDGEFLYVKLIIDNGKIY